MASENVTQGAMGAVRTAIENLEKNSGAIDALLSVAITGLDGDAITTPESVSSVKKMLAAAKGMTNRIKPDVLDLLTAVSVGGDAESRNELAQRVNLEIQHLARHAQTLDLYDDIGQSVLHGILARIAGLSDLVFDACFDDADPTPLHSLQYKFDGAPL